MKITHGQSLDLPQPYNKIGDGPEGPEVANIAKDLNYLEKNIITELIIEKNFKRMKEEINGNYLPFYISRIESYGKKIIISDLNDNNFIIISFGLTGTISFEKSIYTRITLLLDNNISLYFNDKRMFGTFIVLNNENFEKEINKLGPDLTGLIIKQNKFLSEEEWLKIFKKNNRKVSLKLIDQHLVSGIGNYLRSDILYKAHIHPERTTLSDEEWEEIRKATIDIIKKSYQNGGYSMLDYFHPDGSKGCYDTLIFKKKEDSNGYKIEKKKIGSSNIYYVSEIQY